MGNHFYGEAYNETYAKDIKDLTPIDWFVLLSFLGIIIGAVVMGFLQLWGIMVMLIGVFFLMFDVILHVIMHGKNKIMLIFDAVGLIVICFGVVVHMELTNLLIPMIISVYLLICFGLGISFLVYASKKKKKMKEYSLTVEAVCETVDVRRTNLFKFDDIAQNYHSSINDNDLYKPGFHFWVDGFEYFVESTVYYGDLNKGYKDGNKIRLKVKPSDPTQVLPADANVVMELIMGVSWTLIGVVCATVIAVLYFVGVL